MHLLMVQKLPINLFNYRQGQDLHNVYQSDSQIPVQLFETKQGSFLKNGTKWKNNNIYYSQTFIYSIHTTIKIQWCFQQVTSWNMHY